MKLVGYFTKLLNDTVNINSTRLDNLDTRVGAITNALKEAAALDGCVIDTVAQGSWAHKTIIRPAAGLEFDADFLVQLTENLDWNENPRLYANSVWNALSGHSTYGEMSKQKNRCVRVEYANDCHIDVVPYVILNDGREVIVNRTDNEFEDTNPVGFTEWIQEKDTLTNGNLRKTIRLLKYLRDHRGAFKLKSVLLTTLVGNVVDAWRTIDPDQYKDLPTTLVHLVEDLDTYLQSWFTKPSVADPSCPTTTFDERWTDTQYSTFRDRIHDLAPKIRAAYDAATVADSVEKWTEIFGPAFPSSVTNSTAASSAKSAHPSAYQRAPGEVFIEEKFPVRLSHSLLLTCEVSPPQTLNRARRRALGARRSRVPKQRELLFRVVHTDVPKPYQVFWKVRNFGLEAQLKRQLRGGITKDAGTETKTETTSYTGDHYVECYIVKNGICVARNREPVLIT
jgi:hypothetical protein